MHKTLILALGAGLLAATVLQFPGAALAAKKGSQRGIVIHGKTERGIIIHDKNKGKAGKSGKGLNPSLQNPPEPDKSKLKPSFGNK